MQYGTELINDSLDIYKQRIRDTVNEIILLIKKLHYCRHNDVERYDTKMKIMAKQQQLIYLEEAYIDVFKEKGE